MLADETELDYAGLLDGQLGASRSEPVRRAVRSTFGQPTKADKLEARGFTGSEYVDSVRGDLAERLSRLGLE